MLLGYYRLVFLFFFVCWFGTLSYFLGLVGLQGGNQREQEPSNLKEVRQPVRPQGYHDHQRQIRIFHQQQFENLQELDNTQKQYEHLEGPETEPTEPITLTLFLTPRGGDQLKMKIQQQTIMALYYLQKLGVSFVLFDFDDVEPGAGESRGGPWQRLAQTYNFSVIKGLPVNPHGTVFLVVNFFLPFLSSSLAKTV